MTKSKVYMYFNIFFCILTIKIKSTGELVKQLENKMCRNGEKPPYCPALHALGSPEVNHRFGYVHKLKHNWQHFITVYVFSF